MATIALQATWNEEADALSLVFVSGSAGTIVLEHRMGVLGRGWVGVGCFMSSCHAASFFTEL
jgi:hypothetical protein